MLKREPHVKNGPPSTRETLSFLERMCAALRLEAHFENDPPSIREALASFKDERARR